MFIGLRVKYPPFLSDFHETEFSRQIFEKYPNVKCHENPFSGNQVVPCGQTDRHDEANSRYSQCYERA
jgi:hypothetical protein